MEELYALRKQVNQWATCNSTLWLQQQNKKKTVAINSVIYPPSPLKKKKKIKAHHILGWIQEQTE